VSGAVGSTGVGDLSIISLFNRMVVSALLSFMCSPRSVLCNFYYFEDDKSGLRSKLLLAIL
jgi:hypothetical protein